MKRLYKLTGATLFLAACGGTAPVVPPKVPTLAEAPVHRVAEEQEEAFPETNRIWTGDDFALAGKILAKKRANNRPLPKLASPIFQQFLNPENTAFWNDYSQTAKARIERISPISVNFSALTNAYISAVKAGKPYIPELFALLNGHLHHARFVGEISYESFVLVGTAITHTTNSGNPMNDRNAVVSGLQKMRSGRETIRNAAVQMLGGAFVALSDETADAKLRVATLAESHDDIAFLMQHISPAARGTLREKLASISEHIADPALTSALQHANAAFDLPPIADFVVAANGNVQISSGFGAPCGTLAAPGTPLPGCTTVATLPALRGAPAISAPLTNVLAQRSESERRRPLRIAFMPDAPFGALLQMLATARQSELSVVELWGVGLPSATHMPMQLPSISEPELSAILRDKEIGFLANSPKDSGRSCAKIPNVAGAFDSKKVRECIVLFKPEIASERVALKAAPTAKMRTIFAATSLLAGDRWDDFPEVTFAAAP